MSNIYKIGRLVQLGVAKETTRGTTPASASYWLAWDDLALDEMRKNAIDESAYGIIENAVGQQQVKRWMEGTLKAPATDTSFGLMLYSIFGGYAVAALGAEAAVYNHTFSVAESAQHKSLSLYVHDASIQDYSHANCIVHKLDIEYALGKFVQYAASIMGMKGATHAAYTPSQTQENRFPAPTMTLNSAPTTAGLVNVVVATGTAASTTAVTALSVSTDLISVGMYVNGPNITAGTTVAAIVSNTALTLSAASTGNASNLWFSTLQGTATGTSTTAITALSINTNLLQVGMPVYGTNVPAGATVSAIVSSSAFTLSAATSGALTNGLSFGGLVVPIKSAKIAIDGGGEAFDVMGSLDPADFFNKEFKISGTIEAIFRNEADFKTAFLSSAASALQLALVNSNITIGTAGNPSIVITLDQVYITKLPIKRTVKDLVYQTVTFEGTYNVTNSEMAKIVVTNALSTY